MLGGILGGGRSRVLLVQRLVEDDKLGCVSLLGSFEKQGTVVGVLLQ